MSNEKHTLDEDKLGSVSSVLALRLFGRYPELRQHSYMANENNNEEFSLVVELESKGQERKHQLVIWVENGEEPSLGFGPWHTHSGLLTLAPSIEEESDSIIDTLEAIFKDEIVIFQDIGGEHDGHMDVLDLRTQDAILDELTGPYSPGKIQIMSWSGLKDRVVGLKDLEE